MRARLTCAQNSLPKKRKQATLVAHYQHWQLNRQIRDAFEAIQRAYFLQPYGGYYLQSLQHNYKQHNDLQHNNNNTINYN